MSFERAHALVYKEHKTSLTRQNFVTQVKPWLQKHPRNEEEKKIGKNEERQWGCAIQNIQSKQWTTKLGEFSVALVLARLYNDVVYQPKHSLNINGLQQTFTPDFSTKDFFVEVKTRSWCIPGTIGQKNFGSFYHYLPLVAELEKPLIITFLAFAEKEMETNLRITGHQHPSQNACLKFLASKGVYFVPYIELREFIQIYFIENSSPHFVTSLSSRSSSSRSTSSRSNDDENEWISPASCSLF